MVKYARFLVRRGSVLKCGDCCLVAAFPIAVFDGYTVLTSALNAPANLPTSQSLLDKRVISGSYSHKVNLISKLFSRHPKPESTESPFVNWPGQSGKQYRYEVFGFGAGFRPLPGNYIYAGQSEDGNWVPIYIAQTRDLHQRLEGHVRVEDAVANGATHIHAHYCESGQAARCSEEHDLVLRWRPVCNDPVEE